MGKWVRALCIAVSHREKRENVVKNPLGSNRHTTEMIKMVKKKNDRRNGILPK